MNYGANAQADAQAIWTHGGLEPAAGDSGRNPMKGPNSTAKPEISTGRPSKHPSTPTGSPRRAAGVSVAAAIIL